MNGWVVHEWRDRILSPVGDSVGEMKGGTDKENKRA